MACSAPITAFQLENGEIVFAERGRVLRSLFLPCGRCALCRLERSRQWAVRCVHESKMHEDNEFITLTYADPYLPKDRGLRYPDYQLFMKRLRKRLGPCRFFMCGEYGDDRDDKGRVTGKLGRPHYHSLLFGCRFPDKLYFKKSADITFYTSRILTELWPLGSHLIGEVTFQSAAYVARYCLDQVNGAAAIDRYGITDLATGEISVRSSEFARMSLRPGIGGNWLKKFVHDVYPNGEVLVNGHHAKAPRYYDVLYKRSGADDGQMGLRRYERAQAASGDNTDARLLVKEQVAVARLSRLMRSL